uniref:phospholipase A2 n=1 Tax=Heligmosomoides polygyrus TaxID=6339 RepID=A0A183FFU3_HELPZ
LAQVSSKLGELWSSARESIFGEDYWIPSDANEIVLFPLELLRAHKIVFPTDSRKTQLMVVQGSIKNRPALPLHHVVFTLSEAVHSPSYSLYRSSIIDDAVDLCRRCLECKILFKLLDRSKDTKKPIQDLMGKLRQYPLYRMIHIAIACDRLDLFTNENIQLMNTKYKPFESIMKMMVQPEGKYPLHLAIEMHRLKIVRRMLELGADVSLLWEFEACHGLINQPNNEGYVPVMLAIRAANPRCFATLMNFGAELSMRVQGRNPLFEAMQSKNLFLLGMKKIRMDRFSFFSIIKAIIEASPDLVSERDTSGNTALHVAMYKTPLMGLLLLKSKDVDLNATNDAGQTPLHIYTHKGEIGLMITLLSYCCDIDAQDHDGNTALHIAVSKKNVEVCLNGFALNHLTLKFSSLLKSLILCGARTCGPKKVGCVSGCVNEAVVGLLKASSTDCDSPRSSSFPPSSEEYPTSVEVDHPIRDFTQKTFYDGLMARLDEMAARGEKPSNMVNLLSMDGGGIRKTLRECQHIYLRFKDLIFDGWTRPYNSAVLEMFMREAVGEDSLDEIKYPRLMISTVKADFFPVKLEFMRNYRLPLSDKENLELGFTNPTAYGDDEYVKSVSEIPTWKALRRTSAAPMFFSPVDDKYIDGGIIANNPTLDLLSEVQLHNGINTYLRRPEDKVEIGCVLSLGTGQIPLSPLDPLHVEIFNPISSAFAFKNLSLILVDQVTATEGAPVDRSRSWCNAIGVPFFRLSAPLHKDIGLGTKDDHDIAHMMWDCVEYTHQHRPYIAKLVTLLKRIGKTPERPRAFAAFREVQTQTSG